MSGKPEKIWLDVSQTATSRLERSTLVERLVAGGASRLTAERIVEIRLGNAEPGRARRHSRS
jgi:hypothetical protein